MLTTARQFRACSAPRARQQGVVLLITLITLVAMTLAAIGLVRSVDTSNLIAGNLSFQQSTTHSGDTAIETAVSWIENNPGATLQQDVTASGYYATMTALGADPASPATGQSWADFWNQTMKNHAVGPLPTDSAGNQVSYIIQRLCASPGDPLNSSSGCSIALQKSAVQAYLNSLTSGSPQPPPPGQVYYRITARIDGPRSTVSYVQAIVAK
jgi:type IV pilus assembly protein PilX